MQTYENRHFGFRLDFPDNWTLTSWKHLSPGCTLESGYQKSDDEVPKNDDLASLFLFKSVLHGPDSEAIVDGDIEMSVFRLDPREDMRTSIVENAARERPYYAGNGIVKSIVGEGRWNLDGMDFRYLDEESQARGETSRYRFFFRPLGEGLWLYGKIAGHGSEAFENARAIVEGLMVLTFLTAAEAFRGFREKRPASEDLTRSTEDEWPES